MAKTKILTLFLFVVATIFSGCSTSQLNTNHLINIYDQEQYIAIIQDIQERNIRSIKKAENSELGNTISTKFGILDIGLAWTVGPKIDINKEEFAIRVLSRKPLLFEGYGIKDRLGILFSDLNNLTAFRKYGFTSIQEMFFFLYYKISSYQPQETVSFLKELDNFGLINLQSFMSYNDILEYNDLFINNLYDCYKELNSKVKEIDSRYKFDNELLLNTIFFKDIYNQHIYINHDDYLTISFTKKLLTLLLTTSSKITNIQNF